MTMGTVIDGQPAYFKSGKTETESKKSVYQIYESLGETTHPPPTRTET